MGEENKHREIWEKHTVINQVDRLKNGDLALIFDCGYDDFFFEVNNDFHEKLLKYKIDHDFIVRPGAHTNDSCRKSIDYQLLFLALIHIFIPEIDRPGHATSACRAYPEISGGGEGRWKGFTFHPCKEETFEFISNVLDEVVDLFPAPYIHIGGDEVHYLSLIHI